MLSVIYADHRPEDLTGSQAPLKTFSGSLMWHESKNGRHEKTASAPSMRMDVTFQSQYNQIKGVAVGFSLKET